MARVKRESGRKEIRHFIIFPFATVYDDTKLFYTSEQGKCKHPHAVTSRMLSVHRSHH